MARNAQKEFLIGDSSRSHATYRRPSLNGFYISSSCNDVTWIDVGLDNNMPMWWQGFCCSVTENRHDCYNVRHNEDRHTLKRNRRRLIKTRSHPEMVGDMSRVTLHGTAATHRAVPCLIPGERTFIGQNYARTRPGYAARIAVLTLVDANCPQAMLDNFRSSQQLHARRQLPITGP